MDKLVLTDTGGFPLKLDDLLWQNGELDASNWGIYDAIQAHLLAYGTDYIVEGCTYSAPNITAGWIMLDGELMRVDAHAGTDDFFVRTVTFDARGSKTFKDASVNNTYEKVRGVLSGASGSLDITVALRLEDKIVQLIATNSLQEFSHANLGGVKQKYIELGDWNMDANQSLQFNVTSVLSLDPTKIIGYSAIIKGDVGSAREGETYQFEKNQTTSGGSISMTNFGGGVFAIALVRDTGGFFDNTDFDATSFNRGWLIVNHIA